MKNRTAFFEIIVFFATIGIAACGKEESVSLAEFRELPSPVSEDFSQLRMADSLHGVAVGGRAWENGFILSTSDGGQSWQIDTLLHRKMESVMFDRTGQSYVCGQDFALFKQSGSSSWEEFRVNYRWNRACFFPNDRYGVMVGGGGLQGGQIFTFGPEAFWQLDTAQEFPNALVDVCFSDSLTAHAVGIGWVMRSADAGRSWQRLELTGDFFCSVHFPEPLTGYICGSSGTILKTTDGGQSWQEIRKGGSTGKRNKPFRALWFVNAETGYLVGDEGLFWLTENGGADWAQSEQPPDDVDFTDVQAIDGQGWATAKGGRIFYFER